MNLILNSMDAMLAIPYGRTVIGRTEMNGASSAVMAHKGRLWAEKQTSGDAVFRMSLPLALS